MSCGCQELTFAEPLALGMFAEPTYSVGNFVIEDAGNSRYSNLNFGVGFSSVDNTIGISVSWQQASSVTTTYVRITILSGGSVISETIKQYSGNAGSRSIITAVNNPITANGEYEIEVGIDDDSAVNAMWGHRIVTASGFGSGGGDDPRFDAIFASLSNIQDWIQNTGQPAYTEIFKPGGINDQLFTANQNLVDLGQSVTDKQQQIDALWTDVGTRATQGQVADLWTKAAELDAKNAQQDEAIAAAGGGGSSWWDTLMAWLGGAGIGGLVVLILVAVILLRGKF